MNKKNPCYDFSTLEFLHLAVVINYPKDLVIYPFTPIGRVYDLVMIRFQMETKNCKSMQQKCKMKII